MTEDELLIKVKRDMGLTGTYHDEVIKDYIQYVKEFLVDGGVPKEVVDSSSSVGAITQGVNDMWGNEGNGFSNLFIMRAIQLVNKTVEKTGDENV